MLNNVTLYFAIAALGVHLITDFRKLWYSLKLRHTKYHALEPCPRCEHMENLAQESWWQILAIVALIAHLTSDFLGWGI